MTQQDVTLVAAVLAFLASLIGIFLGYFGGRASDFRTAHRQVLAPHLKDLATALHEVVAISSMMLRTQSDTSLATWRSRGKRASQDLEAVRLALRYPLWGLDEALNSLRKLPDWIDHARAYPDDGRVMLEAARRLQDAIDGVIRLSYLRGRPPTRGEIAIVTNRNDVYRAALTRFRITSNPKEPPAIYDDGFEQLSSR